MWLGTGVQYDPTSMFFWVLVFQTISKLCGTPVGLLITSPSLILNPRRMVETNSHVELTGRQATGDIVLVDQPEWYSHPGLRNRVHDHIPVYFPWNGTSCCHTVLENAHERPYTFPSSAAFDLFSLSSSWKPVWLSSLWWFMFALLDALTRTFFFSYQEGLDDIFLPKYPLNCLILTYNYI